MRFRGIRLFEQIEQNFRLEEKQKSDCNSRALLL